MGTPLKFNLNLSLLTFIPSNPSQYPNPDGSSSFSMRDLIPLKLSRFNLNYFHRQKIIHHHRNSLSQIKPVSLAPTPLMADVEGTEKRDTQPPAPEEREKKPERELPPPPEKPEPGDCCGSGCVRCVWDVYYEELEAYNELVKQFNSQSPSNS